MSDADHLFPCPACGSRLAEVALRALARANRATGPKIAADGLSASVQVACPCGKGHCTLPIATRGGPLTWCRHSTGYSMSEWLVEVDVAASTAARLATHVVPPASQSVAVYDPAQTYFYRTDTGRLVKTPASQSASPSRIAFGEDFPRLLALVAEAREKAARTAARGRP